jgi:hypothetical protein
MSKQRRPSLALPSLSQVTESVQSGFSSAVEQGGNFMEGVGSALFGSPGGQSQEATSQSTPLLDAANAELDPQNAQVEAPKNAWQRTIEAYENGNLDAAVAGFSDMPVQAQRKLSERRPDVISAMEAHSPQLAEARQAGDARRISVALNDALLSTHGDSDFMARELWSRFVASQGVSWLKELQEGTSVALPLSEFSVMKQDVQLDSALQGAGTVSFHHVGGPMAAPNSTVEAHVDMSLEAFFTSYLEGQELAKVQRFTGKFIVASENDTIDLVDVQDITGFQDEYLNQ